MRINRHLHAISRRGEEISKGKLGLAVVTMDACNSEKSSDLNIKTPDDIERGKGLHSYIRQRGQLSYSIKSQLQEEKEARLNKTPEKEARGNMKLMYVEEKNE